MQNGSNEKHFEASREERDEDGTNHDNHTDNHGFFVANPLGNVAVDDQADDATNLEVVSVHSRGVR